MRHAIACCVALLLAPLLPGCGGGGDGVSTGALRSGASRADSQWTVTTLAGSGSRAFADGNRELASFAVPSGIAVSPRGTLFVADRYNFRIRAVTLDGEVSTLAGKADGYFTVGDTDLLGAPLTVGIDRPDAVAVDPEGRVYFVARYPALIRKVVGGSVVAVAGSADCCGPIDVDGPSAVARFGSIRSLAAREDGTLFVADGGNRKIRAVDRDGNVSTFAGSGVNGYEDGPAASARFGGSLSVAVGSGSAVYVSDTLNGVIRRIQHGMVTTVAGTPGPPNGVGIDGPAGTATFGYVMHIAVAPDGTIYVTDGNRIRQVTQDGAIVTIAGGAEAGNADGVGANARFDSPQGLVVVRNGVLAVAGGWGNTVRLVTRSSAKQ